MCWIWLNTHKKCAFEKQIWYNAPQCNVTSKYRFKNYLRIEPVPKKKNLIHAYMFASSCMFEFLGFALQIYVNAVIPLDGVNGVIKFSHFACLLVSWIMWLLSKCRLRIRPWLSFRWTQAVCSRLESHFKGGGGATLQDAANNSAACYVK